MTVLPTAPSAAPKKPHPLLSALIGSSRRSSIPGKFRLLSGFAPPPLEEPAPGPGPPPPKPPYLPPCDGGKCSGRESFAAPMRAKKSSFWVRLGRPPAAAGEPVRDDGPAEDAFEDERLLLRGFRSEPVELPGPPPPAALPLLLPPE